MSKRTDCHRPGAIVPSDYVYLFSYSFNRYGGVDRDGEGEALSESTSRKWRPRFNEDQAKAIDALPEVDFPECSGHADCRACRPMAFECAALNRPTVFGRTGQCGICGTSYTYGDVWFHKSGAYVHVGHECADKYRLYADRSDFDAAIEAQKRARQARLTAEKNRIRREAWEAANPDVRARLDALSSGGVYLATSYLRQLDDKGELSPSQMMVIASMENEAKRRAEIKAARDAEVKVACPVGRVTLRGTVVKVEGRETPYGYVTKMTVKVATPEGVWLAWGTVPRGIDAQRGSEVEFSAHVEQGREEHFGLFSRPTKARLVSEAA